MKKYKYSQKLLYDQIEDIGRGRWKWWGLSLLFFIPAALYIAWGPEKRFKEAWDEGNTEAAKNAVKSMRSATIVSFLIGIPVFIVKWLDLYP